MKFTYTIRRFRFCFVTAWITTLPAWAGIPTVTLEELHADNSHEQVTEIILHIIDTYHYKKRPLDDQLSSRMFDNYIENLDPNRSFFTQADIDEFERYRYVLDDGLKETKLAPAFEIFVRYRDRVAGRIRFAVSVLDEQFDFTTDEEYQFDRRQSPWIADNAAMQTLWRKRVNNDFLNLQLAGKNPGEIRETLRKRYERVRTSTFQLNASDVFQSFINAYTTAIEPHTAYFSPRTSENFDISMRLSLEGIGAVLRGETDYTEVQRIVPGGPADLSGQLHAEDKIIGVGQDAQGEIVDVIGWRLDDVVDLIRGPKGSVVRLEILPTGTGPEGPSRVVHLTRDQIKLEEQAAKSEVIELENGGRIGVLDVPTFYSDFAAQARGDKGYKSTTRDVRDLISRLETERIDGIIIDLRGNGGGSLAEALELTGLFIESGPIVQTRDSSGRIEINGDPDPGLAYGGPLAVLVDRNSASASEIFAGAIQDYRRGIIIGEPTFGKGTVQNIVDLNRFVRNGGEDFGRLKTTIAQFYRISGGSNQHKGVVPDIVFPTADAGEEHGERALDSALPWDQVKPAKYDTVSAPTGRFAEIKRRHEDRIQRDKLFQLLLDEIELARAAGERTTVSLNADKRRAERNELLAARRRLENEFRLARGLEPLPETALLEESFEAAETHIDGDGEADEDEFTPSDVLLQEGARVLFDLIIPSHRTASTDPRAKKPVTAEDTEALLGEKL